MALNPLRWRNARSADTRGRGVPSVCQSHVLQGSAVELNSFPNPYGVQFGSAWDLAVL